MFLSLGGVLLRRAITPWATQHRKVVVLVFNSLTGLPLLRMAFFDRRPRRITKLGLWGRTGSSRRWRAQVTADYREARVCDLKQTKEKLQSDVKAAN
jgi:hypothetical protein